MNNNPIRKRFNISLPNLGIVLVMLFTMAYNLHLGYWKQPHRIIANDVLHYYAYLPAVFIYKDIELKFVSENPSAFQDKMWPFWSPIQKNTIMTTMGMSILYAPAFLTTHAIMLLLGSDDDGYGPPYRLGLIIGGWVYLLLSLLLLKKLLLRFYPSAVVAITLIITVLGTNLFYYATGETTMSHSYSFFLFSAFFYLTVRWHEKPGYKWAVLLGLASGLIALVRPTNAVVGILFILWQVGTFKQLADKVIFLFRNYLHLIVLLVVAFMVWVPQIMYWKHITGSYFFYSYGDEQGFFFNNPQIVNNLFSYRKGWFVYTPLMLVAFAGIATLWKSNRGMAVPLIVFSLVNIYIISSWWSWWYGGGFGQRAYVESYALYALGFAAFVDWLRKIKPFYIKVPAFIMILLLVAFNLFQTRQYHIGSIHFVGMNKEAYWHSFLKLKPYGDYYHKLTIPDMEKARKGIYVFEPMYPRMDEEDQ